MEKLKENPYVVIVENVNEELEPVQDLKPASEQKQFMSLEDLDKKLESNKDVVSKYTKILLVMNGKQKTYFTDNKNIVYKRCSNGTMKTLGKLSKNKNKIVKL